LVKKEKERKHLAQVLPQCYKSVWLLEHRTEIYLFLVMVLIGTIISKVRKSHSLRCISRNTDVDECAGPQHMCPRGTTCINTGGGFQCVNPECPEGSGNISYVKTSPL
jgi:hypothetical protein